MNKRILLIIVAIFFLNKFTTLIKINNTDTSLKISVDVKGAVTKPGVYTYDAPVIVDEILGDVTMTNDADTSCINLANEISENTVLTVPTLDECSRSSLVNINTASSQEISLLDGIGETRAQDIVDYRLENGSFSSTEELLDVPGIGETTYENIKPFVTI